MLVQLGLQEMSPEDFVLNIFTYMSYKGEAPT